MPPVSLSMHARNVAGLAASHTRAGNTGAPGLSVIRALLSEPWANESVSRAARADVWRKAACLPCASPSRLQRNRALGPHKRLCECQMQSGCSGPLRTALRHVVTPNVAPSGSKTATLSYDINTSSRAIADSRLEFNNDRMCIGQRSHSQARTLETIHLAASKASEVGLVSTSNFGRRDGVTR